MQLQRSTRIRRFAGCNEHVTGEIAHENGWVTRDELMESAQRYGKSPYGQHLRDIAEGRITLIQNQND